MFPAGIRLTFASMCFALAAAQAAPPDDYLAQVAPALKVDPRDFVLGRAEFQKPKNPGTAGTWYLAYRQTYRGLPVFNGSVRLVVSDGKVVSTRADAYPGIDVAIEPVISLESALAAIAPAGAVPLSSQLGIAPRTESGNIVHRLAWQILLPVEKRPDLAPAQWRYVLDAQTRAILERRNVIEYADVQGVVTGPVRAAVPADPPITLPIAKMEVRVRDVAGTESVAHTDATGFYNATGLAAGVATLTGSFWSPHFRVFNMEALPGSTHRATLTVPASHSWDWIADDISPNQVETNAFHHMNLVRDRFLRGTPFDVDGTPMPLSVQLRSGPFCQSGYSAASGFFFGSGVPGRCTDHALCADIIYHEYTHSIVNTVYAGSGVDLGATPEGRSMNEGWADFFAVSATNNPAQGEGCGAARNIDTPNRRFPDDVTGDSHEDGRILSGALWDLRAPLPADYVESLALRAMKRTPRSYSDYLAAVLEEDDNPAYSTDPAAANNDPSDGTPNIDVICNSYYDLHGIFHPYCSGHTAGLVAILTSPPRTFLLLPVSATSLAVEGTAAAGTANPLSRFTLEYASERAPGTWVSTGVVLTGGGTAPVAGGVLGTIALAGLADGMYRVRLTVTDTAGTAAIAKATFYVDRAIKPGWPQATGQHFFGTPAIGNIDPAYPGLEIVAAGFPDGMLYAWHADGTTVPGWPRSVGLTQSSAPAIADLDGDGTLEVVMPSTFGTVYAFHGDGTPVAGWPRGVPPSIFGSAALADLDGDGKLEVVVASLTQVHAWHHDGLPVAGFPVSPGTEMYGSAAVGDITGDGIPEIVIGARDGRVFAWKTDAGLAGGWPQAVPGATDASPGVAIGDLDGDGVPDVIALGSNVTPTSAVGVVMAWRGTGVPVGGWPRPLSRDVNATGSVSLADVDGMGRLKVVVLSNNDIVHVFRPDGTPLTGWPTVAPLGTEAFPSSPSIADLDGDGSMEVLVEVGGVAFDGVVANKVYAFRFNGALAPGWPKNVSGEHNTSPVVADIDGDGRTDVIVGSDGMFVWGLPGAFDRRGAEWPTYRHDNRRTGTYLPSAGVALLFDTSGSMEWGADDMVPAPVAEQRITLAKAAAIPFVIELNDFNSGKARFGIANFPRVPTTFSCDAHIASPMNIVTEATKDRAVLSTIPGLATANTTSLLAGMAAAARMVEEHRSQAIVLLSDGYHNCPTFVTAGSAEVNDLIARLNENGTRVFSIGFGRPADVDHPLLERLASSTTPAGFAGSQFYDVTTPAFDPATWTPATALQGTYKSILVDALGLQAAVDPLAVISGRARASHHVHLNEHDRRVSFFLSWKKPQEGRLALAVKASDGSIVPAVAAGVRRHLGETHAIVTVDASYLRLPGKIGAAPWTLQVDASGVPPAQREPYQYSVIVDSPLRLEAGLDAKAVLAGQKVRLTATLTEAGQRLMGRTDIHVTVTSPREGLDSWLARNPVTPEELSKIPEKIGSEPLLPVQRHVMYLEQVRGLKPPRPEFGQAIRLNDDGKHGDAKAGDGIYSAEIATTHPGVYSFHFQASGRTAQGLGFDRDRVVQKYVPRFR